MSRLAEYGISDLDKAAVNHSATLSVYLDDNTVGVTGPGGIANIGDTVTWSVEMYKNGQKLDKNEGVVKVKFQGAVLTSGAETSSGGDVIRYTISATEKTYALSEPYRVLLNGSELDTFLKSDDSGPYLVIDKIGEPPPTCPKGGPRNGGHNRPRRLRGHRM